MINIYILLVFISILLNLIFQFLTSSIYSGFLSIYISMFIGTLAGLVSKYVLDKKFIFKFKAENKRIEAKTFFSYSLTGVFTTLLFWGIEISFHFIWGSEIAKYIGAFIGLSIGYSIKYFLDKKFVF